MEIIIIIVIFLVEVAFNKLQEYHESSEISFTEVDR